MSILKRRDRNAPTNTLTIRIAKGTYQRLERYGQRTLQSMSLAIEDLVERGLESEGGRNAAPEN
jgi:predicted DNA-binding protein